MHWLEPCREEPSCAFSLTEGRECRERPLPFSVLRAPGTRTGEDALGAVGSPKACTKFPKPRLSPGSPSEPAPVEDVAWNDAREPCST